MLDATERCHRCRAPYPIVEVVLTTPHDSSRLWFCQGCEPDVRASLAPFPVVDVDDIDDAEHHAMCHCIECDPDFQFELYRESRWDAERHTSIRLAS